MSLFGGSSSKTTQQVTNVSENRSLSDIDANNVVSEVGGNLTIVSTDQNAIDSATQLAGRSVDVAESLGSDAFSLANSVAELSSGVTKTAVQAAGDSARAALSFGESSLSAVDRALGEVSGAYQSAADIQGSALNLVAGASSNAIGAVSDAYETANESSNSFASKALATLQNTFADSFSGLTDFVGKLTSQQQDQLGDTVTALNAISVEQNKSTDQRLQESTESMLKYTLIAIGVLVGGFALIQVFGGKK